MMRRLGSLIAAAWFVTVGGCAHSSGSKSIVPETGEGELARGGGASDRSVEFSTTKAQTLRPARLITEKFGASVTISGNTVAVGDPGESSDRGAVTIFTRHGSIWVQEARVQGSNSRRGDRFGSSVALVDDTLVVGAPFESSRATGVNGNQADIGADEGGGAAYVFTRDGTRWFQQAYLKPSNTQPHASFGTSVAISGNTVVVGSPSESSSARGVNGNQRDTSAKWAGAAYVFKREGMRWTQQAYLKASNARAFTMFGASVAISGDTVAVGSPGDASAARGVNGDQEDTSAVTAGAAYVFTRTGTVWSQEAYLKASNARSKAVFGLPLALSGHTLVVGATGESSRATGVNGNQDDTSAETAGAAYVFAKDRGEWSQQAYLKPSNTRPKALFGVSVAVSDKLIVIGSTGESSGASGVNGDQDDALAERAGAAYLFRLSNGRWTASSYLKATHAQARADFGADVGISQGVVVVGSPSYKGSGASSGDGVVYVF